MLIDGRWEVLARIREGGMGTVYKVRHAHLDEIRVVKVLRRDLAEDPEAKVRFFREGKLVRSVQHPNVATLHDFAEDREGALYMVLEFVDGPNLVELQELGGPLPLPDALEVAIQTLHALGALHSRGIVHRDVSPENILLTTSADGEPLVKLIDLGIAKQVGGEGVTMTGVFLGKLKYASPEQLGSLKPGDAIDGRSDVYSLGVTLFQLLTAELPFQSSTPQGFAMSHLMREPRSFDETSLGGRVPQELRRIVLKCLEKSRDARWRTADELANALEEFRRGGGLPGPSSEIRETIERFRRQKLEEIRTADGPSALVDVEEDTETAVADPDRERTDLLPAGRNPDLPTQTNQGWGGPVPASAHPAARPRSILFALAFAVLVLVVAGAVGIRRWAMPKPPASTAPVAPGSLLLTSTPWARIDSVVPESGGAAFTISDSTTPIRLDLPPGRYRLTLRGEVPGTGGTIATAEIRPATETRVHVEIPGFDLEKAVRSCAP